MATATFLKSRLRSTWSEAVRPAVFLVLALLAILVALPAVLLAAGPAPGP